MYIKIRLHGFNYDIFMSIPREEYSTWAEQGTITILEVH